jgi:hypothetical protein
MNVKPILFNTDMVRAILDGRKTVTRRLMKPQPWKIGKGEYECNHDIGFYDMGGNEWVCRRCGCGVIPMKGGSYFHAPYKPGDIIYVRETWQKAYKLDDFDQIIEGTGRYLYAAGPEDVLPHFTHWLDPTTGEYKEKMPWKPSTYMPKEAARIWLKVTDVRVERLQDITSEQICQEGVEVEYPHVLNGEEKRYAFSQVWNSNIKKSDIELYGWDANPWVWVISFERCEKPEEWK